LELVPESNANPSRFTQVFLVEVLIFHLVHGRMRRAIEFFYNFVRCVMLWLKRIIAFIAGLAIGFAFEFGLLWMLGELLGRNFTPGGGVGWIVFPIITGVAFVRILSAPEVWVALFVAKFRTFPKSKRAFLAGSGLWVLAVLGYVLTFRPELADLSFGLSLSYLHTFIRYWSQVAKIIFFPLAFVALAYWVYTRLVK
jgi:hypothetical protein